MFDILYVEHLKSYENCMSFGCKSIGKSSQFPIDLHRNEAKNQLKFCFSLYPKAKMFDFSLKTAKNRTLALVKSKFNDI